MGINLKSGRSIVFHPNYTFNFTLVSCTVDQKRPRGQWAPSNWFVVPNDSPECMDTGTPSRLTCEFSTQFTLNTTSIKKQSFQTFSNHSHCSIPTRRKQDLRKVFENTLYKPLHSSRHKLELIRSCLSERFWSVWVEPVRFLQWKLVLF